MPILDQRFNQLDSHKLVPNLVRFKQEKISGTLHIKSKVCEDQLRSGLIILQNGQITYSGAKIPQIKEIVKEIGSQYKPNVINVALDLALKKTTSQSSIRELFELLVKMRVLTWQQIEEFIYRQVVLTLEQLFLYPCQLFLEDSIAFDLSFDVDHHGLDIVKVIKALRLRQTEWDSLKNDIPSMEAIPQLPENTESQITDLSRLHHLEVLIDGKNSLIDIAQKTGKDPLEVARSFLSKLQRDGLQFVTPKNQIQSQRTKQSVTKAKVTSSLRTKLPTILTVDDSQTIQHIIIEALRHKYNVLVANHALEGFKMLNHKQIDLMLLDVNMPGIDGLKMCKTLREQSEFKELPIVMLTAQNTRVDKMKGQIAGASYYLYKPFSRDELVQIVDRYIENKEQ
jgi:twitching motility two-component system response regulator PilG